MQVIIATPPMEIYGICLPSAESIEYGLLGWWACEYLALDTAAVFGSGLSFVEMGCGV